MNESQREQRRETAVPARRTFLKHSSLLVAGAAGAQLFLPSNASAQDARVAQDIAVLNYALTLERLEADFYITGLQRFGAAPTSSRIGDTVREIGTQRPILSLPDGLEMRDCLTGSDVCASTMSSSSCRLAGMSMRNGLADGLTGGVAEHAFGRPIPRRDDAVQILAYDGVI